MSFDRELVLIGNFEPDRQESMLRFEQILSEGMAARGWRVSTLRPAAKYTKWVREYRYGGFPKYLGYLDKFYVFPKALRRARATAGLNTVFHIVDHSNAVYAPHCAGAPLIVTCHDLLQVRSALGEFPQNPVSRTGQKYQRWILRHLAQLNHVVCVSDKTRTDLRRLTGLSDSATAVVYLGLNYPYKPMPRGEAERTLSRAAERCGIVPTVLNSAISQQYFIGVGGAHWYKNRTGLVSIFAELQKHSGAPKRLLYVGPPFDPEQADVLKHAGLESAILRLSGVSNEELRAAYSLAAGLIFPSWEEGFGWPIVEAMACGCPVFTSNRAPMTEVGGDLACYLDPADPRSAANVIAAALPQARTRAAAALGTMARWDLSRMLGEYEDHYRAMLPRAASLSRAEA